MDLGGSEMGWEVRLGERGWGGFCGRVKEVGWGRVCEERCC